MQALLAVKAHKARCLKVLAVARKALDEETDKLIATFSKMGAAHELLQQATLVSSVSDKQSELQISPGQPFTPSPTTPSSSGKICWTVHFQTAGLLPPCLRFLYTDSECH
jgi:hypothetical protein